MAKTSLDSMLKAVLANAGKEQSMHYPPSVFDAHYNAASAFLLNAIAEAYPRRQSIVDIAEPFLGAVRLPVFDGIVKLPAYRNFLSASVRIKADGSSCDGPKPCDAEPIPFTAPRSGVVRSAPVRIVDQTEWDNLTDHEYKYPTYKEPIGCFFATGELQVCPFDIYAVEVRYLKNENAYRYGYTMQPDDTYIFDANTTIESEWGSNAYEYLYKGLNHLYSVYARDQEMREWSVELKKLGLI